MKMTALLSILKPFLKMSAKGSFLNAIKLARSTVLLKQNVV